MSSTRTEIPGEHPSRRLRLSTLGSLVIAIGAGVVGALVGLIFTFAVAYVGYLVTLLAGGLLAGRLDKAGRLPDWARAAESLAPVIDYSVLPPDDGPIFNGRADQAPSTALPWRLTHTTTPVGSFADINI